MVVALSHYHYSQNNDEAVRAVKEELLLQQCDFRVPPTKGFFFASMNSTRLSAIVVLILCRL
jgi:hypothetical protein